VSFNRFLFSSFFVVVAIVLITCSFLEIGKFILLPLVELIHISLYLVDGYKDVWWYATNHYSLSWVVFSKILVHSRYTSIGFFLIICLTPSVSFGETQCLPNRIDF